MEMNVLVQKISIYICAAYWCRSKVLFAIGWTMCRTQYSA